MRELMAAAPVGDDVYGEDATVNRLQDRVADMAGKEAALFVPSGTMGNLVALASHCGRGDEVILGQGQHIFQYEGGGASALLGVSLHCIPNAADGKLCLGDIRAAIREDDPHYPATRLVALENTHNSCGGRVLPLDYIDSVGALCREHSLLCHMDGARIFNAAVAAGVGLNELLRSVDSASICLSKGLAAPVGSVVVGSADFIRRCVRARKMLGGGMRQAGVLAACGLWALDNSVPRLYQDHDNAKTLALGLGDIPGVTVDVHAVETNIVFFDVDPDVIPIEAFIGKLRDDNVIMQDWSTSRCPGRCRAVTHLHIERDDIVSVLASVTRIMQRQRERTG